MKDWRFMATTAHHESCHGTMASFMFVWLVLTICPRENIDIILSTKRTHTGIKIKPKHMCGNWASQYFDIYGQYPYQLWFTGSYTYGHLLVISGYFYGIIHSTKFYKWVCVRHTYIYILVTGIPSRKLT